MKMLKLSTLLLGIGVAVCAHAEKDTPFMFSVWPSKYTQFPSEDYSVYGLRLAPGCGIAERVYGLDVGSLLIATNGMSGVQLGGVFAGVGKEMNGVQLGGFISCAENLNGLQFGVANICKDVDGVQVGYVSCVGYKNKGSVDGVQLGLRSALAIGTINGVQIGGIVAINGFILDPKSLPPPGDGTVNGVQLGGLASVVYGGTLNGVQIGGLYSGATVVNGLQLGAVNYAGDGFCGVQLGIVNISLAKEKQSNKFQLGLVNYMESAAVKCLPFVNMSF